MGLGKTVYSSAFCKFKVHLIHILKALRSPVVKKKLLILFSVKLIQSRKLFSRTTTNIQ